MKTKVKRLSKRTLAVFLGVLMLATCLIVGNISVVNAWTTGDNGRVYISFDNGSNWESKYINSSGYADFEISQDCPNTKFKCVAEGTWYGYKVGSPSNGDGAYDCNYYASSSGGDISISLKAGQYVVKYNDRYDSNTTLEFNLYRKKGMIDYGWNSNGWSGQEMSYTGDGVYKYTITGTGDQLRFRTRFVDGSTTTSYYPSTTDNIRDNTSYDIGYSASTGTSNNYWYVDTQDGAQYDVWLKNGKIWMTISGEGTDYYLTGYINGGDVTSRQSAYKFTESSTSGVYTLELSSTTASQYVTVYDTDGNAYHPGTHGASSGTASSTTDSSPGNDNKWLVSNASGKTVTFTWDTTGSNPTLSWTVSSSGSSSMTATSYKLLYGAGNGGEKLSSLTDTGLTVYQTTEGKYYINLSSWTSGKSTGTNYYFALSDGTTPYNQNILGEATSNPTSAAFSETDSGNYISGSTQNYGENLNGTYYAANFARISFSSLCSGLSLTVDNGITTSNTITYHFTTSASAIVDDDDDDDTTTVNVYAKDGAAPINWDNKNSAGATSLNGLNSNYYYNFARIADTTVSSSDSATFTSVDCDIASGTSGSTYVTGEVEAGSILTITTTIEDTKDNSGSRTSWRSKYYVAGWCINGKTYSGTNSNSLNTTKNTSTGVYTMTYTVPEDISDGYKIEITPIYYFIDNSNTITFYLEGYDSVSDEWGDTPYVYPFYGDLYGYQNSFGTYPGQPIALVDGKYSTQIPITSNAIYSNTNDGTTIKGVTISNGYADHVHRNIINTTWQTLGSGGSGDDQFHMQTYDFDDFYKIYNEKRDSSGNRPNSIILRMKNETTRNNRDTYGGDNNNKTWSYSYTSNPADSLSSSTVQDIASSGNGWELLTDRYGRPVDLFGNVIGTSYSATTEANKTAIRAISTGYNENIAGDYGTSWLIYTPDANTCTATDGVYTCSSYTLQKDTTTDRYAIPPSIFLLSSTSSFNTTTYPDASHTVDGYTYTDSVNNYKTMYTTLKTSGTNGTNALGRYVYISYEKNAQRIGSSDNITNAYGAKRLDARWYYTYSTDMVSANIKVQCWNETQQKYIDVAFVTNGSGYNGKNNVTTTSATVDGISAAGLKAYFTNTGFDGDVESGDILINSEDFAFKAVTASGWMFDSWQLEYDNGASYSQISTSATASTTSSSSETIVARFKPITQGTLNISHEIGTDSTHTGTGTAAIQVKVYSDDSMGTQLYDSGTVTEDVTLDETYISNSYSDYYIDVTLKTTPSGDDEFYSFSYDTFNTTKSISATVDTSGTTMTSNFGFTVGDLYTNTNQTYKSLSYLSYLTAVTHKYVITYGFASRGSASNDKSYTVKGTFTSNEYSTYVDSSVAVASRTVTNAFIKKKAPFESNFKKTLTLDYNGATQTCASVSNVITHTINISYSTTESKSQYAIFDLPYAYTSTADPEASPATKMYTAVSDTYGKIVKNDNTATFEIDTEYQKYFTSTGSQDNVSKVTDTSDPNHTGNDFITAPNIIWDSSADKYLYFNYWQIYKTDRTTKVTKVYYVDFNYLAYDNYYVTPIYKDKDATGDDAFIDASSDALGAAITYLGDSRNQWNTNDDTAHNESSYAGDLIYNDFAISYSYQNQELKSSSDVEETGVIIERIAGSESGASSSISNMSTYQTMYSSSESTSKNAIETFLSGGSAPSFNYIKQVFNKEDLNNKNRMEKYIALYNNIGQDASLNWKTPKSNANYVYRAYSYIKLTDGSIAVSDPAYFCMKYTANLSYNGE